MKDLICKLSDLNAKDPNWEYSIEIKPSGAFILHGISTDNIFNKLFGLPEKKRQFACKDAQDLRTEMYRIILNLQK